MIPYTWEEIKEVLIKELKSTKSIMTFGTIGSCNPEHDIDVIITKKPSSKTSDFFREIHTLFDNVDSYMRTKYNKKVIRFSIFSHQEEIKKLGKWKKGDLLFHTMIYNSLYEIKIDWQKSLKMKESAINLLRSHYSLLKGKKSDLFSESFSKENIYGNVYITMFDHDRLNSNLPDKFLVEKMNELFHYVLEKRLKEKNLVAKNRKEVYEIFYKTLDILDKKEKEEENKENKQSKSTQGYSAEESSAKLYEQLLKKSIKSLKIKNIGFVGLLKPSDSCNYDLDTIILPSLKGRVGSSLIEIMNLIEKIDNLLKKRKERYFLSVSPKKIMHQMVYGFATTEEGEEGLLPVHIIYFPDYKSFKKIPPKIFFEEIKTGLIPVYGKFEIVRELKNIKQEKLDPYFVVLNSVLGTKIRTLSQRDERAAIKSLLDYLNEKYGVSIKIKIPETEKQRKDLFVQIMKKLDKITYNN